MNEYLMMLDIMDEDKMKDWEKRFMSEVTDLRNIHEDIQALNQHLDNKSREIVIPDWIMDPQLR